MSSPEELDYEEELKDSPATSMLKKDLQMSPDENPEHCDKQGWTVSRQGIYQCLVPGCNGQQYSSTTCMKRHWTNKHTRMLQRYRCCKKDCPTVNEQLWKAKKHAKHVHNMDDASIKKDWFPGFQIKNEKFIDPGELKGPEETRKEVFAKSAHKRKSNVIIPYIPKVSKEERGVVVYDDMDFVDCETPAPKFKVKSRIEKVIEKGERVKAKSSNKSIDCQRQVKEHPSKTSGRPVSPILEKLSINVKAVAQCSTEKSSLVVKVKSPVSSESVSPDCEILVGGDKGEFDEESGANKSSSIDLTEEEEVELDREIREEMAKDELKVVSVPKTSKLESKEGTDTLQQCHV